MTTNNSSQFLGYLHSFRGFAIINIVLIHSVVASLVAIESMNMTNPIAIINEVLFHDSTLYFAVISGLLYTAILKDKGYKRFYTSKLKYVILPYLFITAIVTIFKLGTQEEGSTQSPVLFYFETLLRDLWYGKANALFWYIPVLIFLYLVTPVVDFLINLKRVGFVLLLIIMIAPLVISRVQMVFEYILSIKTMIYFTGAYAVGMYLGTNLDKKLDWVKKHFNILLAISFVTTIILFYLYIQDIDMFGIVSLKESAFYAQKICLTGIFIVLFQKLGQKQPNWLHKVARDSFAIYFLHGFFVFGGIPLFMFLLGYNVIAPFNTIIGSLVLLLFSIGLSMLIVLGFRKLFGKNSRMLLGS